MSNLIYWVGLFVTTLFAVYLTLLVFYLILKHDVKSAISADSMPVLRPVPIPTKYHKTFLHKLIVFIFEVRKWKLVENWHYKLKDEVEIVIPKDFKFDGASIPRPFWAVLSPVGLLLIPGLIHDYGYKYKQIWKVGEDGCPEPYGKGEKKEYWDNLFKTVGENVNGFFLINVVAWLAVAVGGDRAWNKHRKVEMVPDEPILEGCN
jgi:hypothetical protein